MFGCGAGNVRILDPQTAFIFPPPFLITQLHLSPQSELAKMAMEMVFLATTTARPSLSPSSSLSSLPFIAKATCTLTKSNSKPQFRYFTTVSLPTSISLFAIFTARFEAKSLTLPKDQIVSSITEVEKTIDQVQEVSSSFFNSAQHLFEVVAKTLKPGIDAAVPIFRQAGEQVVKITSPVISEASKQAQDAIQSTVFDTAPVFSAANVKFHVLYCISILKVI